jgi:Ca2+/Na+ antiporter
MPVKTGNQSAWNRLAGALETIAEAFKTLAEGVSASPPSFRITGLCVTALVIIFAFVALSPEQSVTLDALAVLFAIFIMVLLKMCFNYFNKAKISRDDSLRLIQEKTNEYEDGE